MLVFIAFGAPVARFLGAESFVVSMVEKMPGTKIQLAERTTTRDQLAVAPSSVPLDDYFSHQWHLFNGGQSGGATGVDLNVTPVWEDYTGDGVVVAVFDDSVQYTHHEIDGNYDASLQILGLDGQTMLDAMPNGPTDNHGTAVAGVIGAERNDTGTVGVAYDATLTGADVLDYGTFAEFENAFSQMRNFDVVNNSWGFTTPFIANEQQTWWQGIFGGLKDAVDNGRGGLGSIVVFAGGNDRTIGRNVNDSNLTGSHYSIAVAAISHEGYISYYSTPGAALLVSAPSSGTARSGIWTSDRLGSDGYDTSADYTSSFGGTSAAAPMVSGVVALMIEANPFLGWRDVQEILAHTARHVGHNITLGNEPEAFELYPWVFNGAETWNGGGLHFNNDYGFGLVDALAAVRLAETWTIQSTSLNEARAFGNWSGIANVPDNDSGGTSFNIFVGSSLLIEAVELDLTGLHTWIGDLTITLTSPHGTDSILLSGNGGGTNFPSTGWTFTSQAFRGELSAGTWTVTIADSFSDDTGFFTAAALTTFGRDDTVNDTYIYTNEFGTFGWDSARQFLTDLDGGTDTINAAAVSSNTILNLNGGGISTVAERTFSVAVGSAIENAYSGDGDDTIIGTGLANLLRGGRGQDVIYGNGGDDNLVGNFGADILVGGDGADTLWGDDGEDTLSGGSGDDILNGGDWSDILWGNDGDDILVGGTGHDILMGQTDNDRLFGGAGFDFLSGSDGRDELWGEAGDDVLIGGAGDDTMVGGTEDDTMWGDAGEDTISGGAGNDILIGGDWSDVLWGDQQDDILVGNTGHDILVGGIGNDELWGHDGFDSFMTYSADIQAGDRDVVGDYDANDTYYFQSSISDILIVDTPSGAAFDVLFETDFWRMEITNATILDLYNQMDTFT